MSKELYEFKPDWSHLIAPGESIFERMQDLDLSQKAFAEAMDYSLKHIHKLIKGEASITNDTALRLERVLLIPASFWMNLENNYRRALAIKNEKKALAKESDWLGRFPLKDIIKFKWIEKRKDMAEQIVEVLKFFGVASISAWNNQMKNYYVAFKSCDKFSQNEVSIQTWIRKGEIEASKIECKDFDKAGLTGALEKFRAMTNMENPAEFVSKMQNLSAKFGVAVVFAPTPTKCPMSGVTKWLSPNKALLLLSLRHKTNDHMWFAFFHEIAHILKHRKQLFLDDGRKNFVKDEAIEDEADAFASDLLISPKDAQKLSTLTTKKNIVEFSENIGIASGIVVGRMQYEKLIQFSYHNELKIRYKWEY